MKTLIRLKETTKNYFDIIECHEAFAVNEKIGLKQSDIGVEIDFLNGLVYEGPLHITESAIMEEELRVMCKLENRLIEVEMEWNKEHPSGKAVYKSKK